MTDTDALINVFRAALALPEGTDVRGLAYGGHPNWDSVGHMALIAEIEDRFDLMFDTEDVLALGSFDDALAMIRRQAATPEA